MTKITNTLLLGGVLAASSLMSSGALAGALTGNVGVMSDYFSAVSTPEPALPLMPVLTTISAIK